MKKTVLLLETIADEALSLLDENTRVIPAYEARSLADILETEEIHAVITRGKGQINPALLDACPALEVVARCGVGLDNVDVQAATERGVKVVNAPGSNAGTIAEHALTLMLMLMRNTYESALQVKAGAWNWRNQFSGDELSGKTLGILGMGNIGKRVARLGEAFGMNIVYWDKQSTDLLLYQSLSFEAVLQQADIISVHLPLTDETDQILSTRELSLMKPNAILINTARGALIDEAALLQALDEGTIGGFGADVLSQEPPAPDNQLAKHPKTIITPHVGSLTATTYRLMCIYTVQNVVAILAGGTPDPRSIFNREALDLFQE
ncbi:2-hydroxyacid dehydrogenase [Tellurirhabdus bombi]|uniref:2-hydroxyacid dehydrogenase n=1 Tax=Tellurirhabdus bombi TaxID=2907205 RepID=UPI001F40386C|nr:hydroxyacid dehydrogenase [Tellurirhabdus bombi]